MKRRVFIKKAGLGAAGLAFMGGIYSWLIEPFWLEVVKLEMDIRNLPPHLEGKTLMQISDIHVGNRFNYQFIIDSFKTVQKLEPDFVVYTGDYVSYEDEEQFKQLREVMQHAVIVKSGTAGILGNHDYGDNWSEKPVADEINAILKDAGVEMLSNEQTEWEGLQIIGMDDYWGLRFDPTRAFENYNPHQPAVLLCHNPDVCDLDVWSNYQGWILSGHTHGGQVKPPFLPPPVLPVKNRNYTAGKFDLKDGRTLYINRALGHSFQVRFNVRPEITLFTLRKA